MEVISVAAARRLFPLIRSSYARRVLIDRGTADMDVDQIHQGFLRMLRQRGGTLICAAGVAGLTRANGRWTAATPHGEFAAPVVINAAGAWGEVVGQLAGAAKIGLQPKRRSIAVIPPPNRYEIADWPMISDVGETWYCKPQGGKFIVSPADETPVDPHDAYAEEMTLAEGIDRFQQAVNFEVTHVSRTWAGLRSFVADGNPVVGFDPNVEGFFWLVGQGGYGIQSAPGLSRLAAALVRREPPPTDIMAEGLNLAEISPNRIA
jgi:D-arginine dehydrogenase